MRFAISHTSTLPPLDSMPVMKVTHYPLEPADFKPFAQARMCFIDGKGLFLRMWSFEVRPICNGDEKDSFLIFKCRFLGGKVLCVMVNAAGVYRVTVDGGVRPTEDIQCKMFTGEDLQGIYWGCQLFFTNSFIKSIDGVTNLSPGHKIEGNIFKTCEDPTFRHHGCLFYDGKEPFDPKGLSNFGEFVLVDY